jgi:hypothetical protein
MTFLFLLHSTVPFKTNFPIAAHEFRYASQMTALEAARSPHTLPLLQLQHALPSSTCGLMSHDYLLSLVPPILEPSALLLLLLSLA